MKDNSYLQPQIDAMRSSEAQLKELNAFTSIFKPQELPDGQLQTNFSQPKESGSSGIRNLLTL